MGWTEPELRDASVGFVKTVWAHMQAEAKAAQAAQR